MERKKLLEICGLNKTFGDRKVIENFNLRVDEGDIYGFLGENGSGKTTTIRMMLGLIFPDSGQVKVGGKGLYNSGCSVDKNQYQNMEA